METVGKISRWLTRENLGAEVSFAGALFWCFSLPFAQIQTTRFTSIFLFTILGGFLISILRSGFSMYRVPYPEFRKLLPFVFLSLLPFLHGMFDGQNGKELILRAPLFIIPFVFAYQSRFWHSKWAWFLAAAFSLSFLVTLVFLFSSGFQEVYRFVRSEDQEGPFFIMHRPVLGFCSGLIFFLLAGKLLPQKRNFLPDFLAFVLIAGLLFVVLAKIALLAFLPAFLLYLVLVNRKSPWFLTTVFLLGFASATLAGIKILRSKAFSEILSEGGISFNTIPKIYSNSINNRLLLWRASFDLLADRQHWISGYAPEHLQPALDQQVEKYNGYLPSWHLNPHNQLLYIVLKYGAVGLLVYLWLWFSLFRMNLKPMKPAWLAAWFFVQTCSMTEVYFDIEMGVQLFLFLFVVSGEWTFRREMPVGKTLPGSLS